MKNKRGGGGGDIYPLARCNIEGIVSRHLSGTPCARV